MSFPVNRSSDSPKASDVQPSEAASVQSQQPTPPSGDTPNAANQAATDNSTATMYHDDIQRQQPIPPPSEPMQYRAIGLIQGQYMPSAEQMTRGTMVAADGTLIDAVLLGRVMSLVKNHLDLNQPHLWVVYPRIRQEEGHLHVQIVGVWEPETLAKDDTTESAAPDTPDTNESTQESAELSEVPDTTEASTEAPTDEDASTSPVEEQATPPSVAEPSQNGTQPEAGVVLKDGYFSIRGEVIYQSRENEHVVIKIRQSPRKASQKTKFFKLRLNGLLGEKVIGHFWDLHAQLQGNVLQIQEGKDIGIVSKRQTKFSKHKPGKRRPSTFKNKAPNYRSKRKGEPSAATTSQGRASSLPKPVKRGEKRGSSGTSGSGNSS